MSGPVSPPLATTESGTTVRVQPTNTLEFNGADFTVTGSGSKATISIDSTGTGAALTDTHIGFGSAANLLTGSANFTFTEDTGSGPVVLLTGDNPKIDIQDDTAATDYKTRLTQSGASLFVSHSDSTGTNREVIRVSNSYVFFNDDGLDIDVKMEGENVDNLFRLDAAQDNIGIATAPDSDALLHIKDDGSKAATVRVESTDTDADVGPVLELRRDPAQTAVVNDDLGKLTYIGPSGDGSGTPREYAQIETQVQGITSGQEHGRIMFRTSMSGTMTEFLRASASGVEINAFEQDIDTKISSDGVDGLFTVNGGQNNIGIGTNAPDSGVERLHVKGAGQTAPMVKIESEDDPGTASSNPVLQLYNSSTPGMNLKGGELRFSAKNDAGSEFIYGSIGMTIRDSTANEDGSLEIRVAQNGAENTVEYMRIGTATQRVFINPGEGNIDTQISSENLTQALFVNAGNDNVGIGTDPDSDARLHVKDDGTKAFTAMLESTDDDANNGPVLALWRNSASPADNDKVGAIDFRFENDGGSRHEGGLIEVRLADVTATTEDTRMTFQNLKSGVMITTLTLKESEVCVNDEQRDINFRVESNNNAEMLRVDAGLDRVFIGSAGDSGGATLQIKDNTISHYCNVNTIRSDAVSTMVMVNEDNQGQMWVHDSVNAHTLQLVEGGVKGMHFQFMSTDGNITVDPQGSDTLNGGTASLTRSTNYEIYDVFCYDTGKWALSNPA